MSLDINTLFLVTIYVEAMLGLLLLFAWVQNSGIMAVAWWGSAHLLRAASVVLFGMYGSVSGSHFDRSCQRGSVHRLRRHLDRRARVRWPLAEPARLVRRRRALALRLPHADRHGIDRCTRADLLRHHHRLIPGSTAYEFWRGRSEPLVSRWPAIFMLFAHGALFLLRTPLSAILPWSVNSQIFESVWMTVLSFEALLFTIAIAFILLAMAKERTELRHKTAALVDSLTGIANRRAFMEGGALLARRHESHPKPAAVLLMDLDHFKQINDTFGHGIGDRVLQVFADNASANVTSMDLVGRLGGEEFGALLYDCDKHKALAVAEQIRAAFATHAVEVDGRPVNATVSIGVAVCEQGPLDVSGDARASRSGALSRQGTRP